MNIFWRKKMVYNENNKDNTQCEYECCQCKKIFMILVILILTFMAGIMVGNCGRCRYSDSQYYNRTHNNINKHQTIQKKFHRGMHETPQPLPNTNQTYPNDQVGGFLIEIDQTN